MKEVIIKKTGKKGKGLFANKDFKEGKLIFHHDKSKLRKYSSDEISKMPDNDHADYVGHGKYIIDFHPCSYMNHSCDPNTIVKMKSILESNIYALRNIKKGEELTHDYSLTAVDQIDNKDGWMMDCNCGSKNCRKKIIGDFFKLPVSTQRKYYKYLPYSIKIKYKERINKLK
ncbi:MAG: SET domain-containing methyltransferase [Candidatus Pacearchaeota archaeon]